MMGLGCAPQAERLKGFGMMKWILVLLVLVGCGAARACPLCKDSASNQEGAVTAMHDASNSNGENISGGLNTSIYVMGGCLLGVMGLVSTVIVRGVRSSNRVAERDRR
jgi:hypothetical protein